MPLKLAQTSKSPDNLIVIPLDEGINLFCHFDRSGEISFMKNCYYIYILASDSGTLYIGVTNNLERRVYEHKNRLIHGFTKKYHCHKLIYFEEYN